MKKIIILAILFGVICSAYSQIDSTEIKLNRQREELGIDTTTYAITLQMEQHKCYVFSSKYEFSINNYWVDEVSVRHYSIENLFDLDTNIVKYIESEVLTLENCRITDSIGVYYANEQNVARLFGKIISDSIKCSESYKQFWKEHNAYLTDFTQNYHLWYYEYYSKLDRQYYGYINSKGDSIVRICLIADNMLFNDHFQQKLYNGDTFTKWIRGHTGAPLYLYNISKKRLSINYTGNEDR